MARPDKAVRIRRNVVLAVLSAGGSRRAAAHAAGVDPRSLRRWLAKGRNGAPGGRWRTFLEAVEAAETGPKAPRPIQEVGNPEAELRWAMAYLERTGEFDPEPDPPPVPAQIIVTFGTPEGAA